MRAKAVAVLGEAADDLAAGIAFYDAQEQGVGRYFFDSVLSDIDSLQLYAGIHHTHLVKTKTLGEIVYAP